MTDMTRVLAFRKNDDAAAAAGFWKGEGYNVAVAGPTDAIKLSDGTQPALIWESGETEDWVLVIATKKELTILED
ncbi:hypothetical protein HFP57_13375 [Parasphingopyxis algicola]|uniref:hypothetical protein n=1 Tax=Parasphingopyxis algicola TaxID=2026624 RepID=UPI0015A2EEAB|nr:hypothetical protein [Parasphingopyxis algicola]QLC25916.1 hypothetical protein HFP57_13375 [Parasphingopyxis algicola]